MYLAGFIVAGFLVAGVYAFAWLRGRRDHYHRAALIVPLTVACLAAPVQLLVGDWAARTVAENQPTKLAAFEGLDETTGGRRVHHRRHLLRRRDPRRDHDPRHALAPRLPRPRRRRCRASTRSRQATARRSAVVRNAFTVMVAIGTALAPLAALYLFTWLRRGRLPRAKWFYRAVVARRSGGALSP